MLADVAGSLLGVCLFPLFVLAPGFALAWLTNIFDFRRRTAAFQAVLSLPLSIAICPSMTYLGARFGSMTAVWILYAASWIYVLGLVALRRVAFPRPSRTVAAIVCAWTAIAILSLVDLQAGHRAWFPAAAFDYSVRTQFIQAIGLHGVPPANPFFLPGHAVALRYHYFWMLLCSLVDLAGGAAVSARQAWIAGAVWCGFGLMAAVALYLRLFWYRGPATFRRRALIAILLLGVTGLDILPIAGLWLLQAAGMHGVLPSGEWWNEQVDGFVYTTIWESHYLAGLIACLMAFLLLWESTRRPTFANAARYAGLAALALASATGAAIYIVFVFGLFLALWTAVALFQRLWREFLIFAAAGVAGLALALPYLLSLRGKAEGGPPLQLWVRSFYPIDGLFAGLLGHGWKLWLVNGLALPLNYFLELGFFLAAALLWWKKHRASGRPLNQAETATILMIGTSVAICTFLRSSVIGNNDLGWRGFLVAQFGLLLWAVDVVGDWGTASGRENRGFLTALLVLGALGSAYELGINRFYAVLADRGTVATVDWIAPDRDAGRRIYAVREAGEWAARHTAPDAIVQFNPHVFGQNTAALLYSGRRSVAAGDDCISAFGGDPALCPALIATLNQVFPPLGQNAPPTFDSVCSALPIDLIAAGDTDPAWSDRRSWVWTQSPVFANEYVRLFRCDPAERTDSAGASALRRQTSGANVRGFLFVKDTVTIAKLIFEHRREQYVRHE